MCTCQCDHVETPKALNQSSVTTTQVRVKTPVSSTSTTATNDGDSKTATDTSNGNSESLTGELIPGLIKTNLQPMFQTIVPNALDPTFVYTFNNHWNVSIEMCKGDHVSGLVDASNRPLTTSIYGYRPVGGTCSWPGMTLEVQAHQTYSVTWLNKLPAETYLLTGLNGLSVVDTSIHWAYGMPGYETCAIELDGPPTAPHLHGGHSPAAFDGNPEYFFSSDFAVKGPQWKQSVYEYQDDFAKLLWYHDHALGMTRLNVYAGMAGFYIVRDTMDTGKTNNPLNLPAYPYEAAYVIQDRMFKEDGSLFYPAFPGDPLYTAFIDEEGVDLPSVIFPDAGPTTLAEFFGDVMVVNGKIWPKADVEPRKYRLRLLNGCDSRFLILEFIQVTLGKTNIPSNAVPLPFTVIGTDQGLAYQPRVMTKLIFEPAGRYDIIFDFAEYEGSRIIVKNVGADEPFGGDFDAAGPPHDHPLYSRTNRIMAFDVVLQARASVAQDDFDALSISSSSDIPAATRVRKVGLFEGRDQFGRLLPMLGTVEPATDYQNMPIYWPNNNIYQGVELAGKQVEGTLDWHGPTTENPALGSTEEWEIWNLSVDAHPIHLHLVYFDVVGRNELIWDSSTTEDSRVSSTSSAAGDGTYLIEQPVVLHDSSIGKGYRVGNPTMGSSITMTGGYFDDGRKDMVVALPNQITRIRATFDKAGRYSWHCHILSHEDHGMMRVLHVGAEDHSHDM
jgi:spore coat protein A, manganese oxidase